MTHHDAILLVLACNGVGIAGLTFIACAKAVRVLRWLLALV